MWKRENASLSLTATFWIRSGFRKLLGSELEEAHADMERGKNDVIKKDGEIEPLGITWR